MSRSFFNDLLRLPQLGPNFVAHENSDKLGPPERVGVTLILGDPELVLEGLVAAAPAGSSLTLALLLDLPGLPVGGQFLGFGGGLGGFAGGGLSFTLAALRRARFPGAGLDLVASCPVVAVLAFLLFACVTAHFRPLVSTHFNNYNNQILISTPLILKS